jgi:small subunit ribosomal protein S4e
MGYKGQRKIQKRVAAPKNWYLGKLKGVYGVKASAGPHKTKQCLPLCVLLQQRLKYAFSRDECRRICRNKEGLIKVDGQVRRDHRFPLGNMDVVSIEKTNEHFRILLDAKGRFVPHRIDAKEASFKLCKVVQKRIGKNKIPYVVTHDGRTIRYPHPDIEKGDSVKLNLATKDIELVIKNAQGASCTIVGGNNIGRTGVLQSVEKHPGSFDIAHVRDANGKSFSTRAGNVIIIGAGKEPVISLPKGDGLRLTLLEERNERFGDDAADSDDN